MPQVLALALGVAALYYFLRGRLGVSFFLLALSILAYEASVLFLLAMVWELAQKRSCKNVLLASLSILPFLLYEFILYRIFGQLPILTSGSNIGIPFQGLLYVFRYFLSFKPFLLASQLIGRFDFSLMVSAGLVLIFSLFIYFCIIPAASRFGQSVFHKALLLQVGYAFVAAPAVYQNFYNVARVFGAVFSLLAICYTIAPVRYYKYLFTFGALFTWFPLPLSPIFCKHIIATLRYSKLRCSPRRRWPERR